MVLSKAKRDKLTNRWTDKRMYRHTDDEGNKARRLADTTKIHVSRWRKVSGYESSVFILDMRHKIKNLMVQVLYVSGLVNNITNAHVVHI